MLPKIAQAPTPLRATPRRLRACPTQRSTTIWFPVPSVMESSGDYSSKRYASFALLYLSHRDDEGLHLGNSCSIVLVVTRLFMTRCRGRAVLPFQPRHRTLDDDDGCGCFTLRALTAILFSLLRTTDGIYCLLPCQPNVIGFKSNLSSRRDVILQLSSMNELVRPHSRLCTYSNWYSRSTTNTLNSKRYAVVASIGS